MKLFSQLAFAAVSTFALSLPKRDSNWVTLWAVAPFLTDGPSAVPPPYNDTAGGLLANTTIRQTLRPSFDAPQIRFKLSNYFSDGPLTISHATVACSKPNADGVTAGQDLIDTSSTKQVTFSGQAGTTLAVGDILESDAVDFGVTHGEDISLSLFLGEGQHGNITAHFYGQTSWLLGGDQTGAESFDGGASQISTYFLASLEGAVFAQAIIAIGDSTTDRAGTDINTYVGWTDDLAVRLQNDPTCRGRSVGNVGIGANTLNRLPSVGEPATARLQRDVLDQAGVKYCIVFEGINDIGSQNDSMPDDTYNSLIQGYTDIVSRLRQNGIKAIGATITPFREPSYGTGLNLYWTPEREQTRLRLNEWIQTPGNYDGVIDFSAAITNQSEPTQMQDAYASPDFLHPGPLGYQAMANAIDLSLFA